MTQEKQASVSQNTTAAPPLGLMSKVSVMHQEDNLDSNSNMLSAKRSDGSAAINEKEREKLLEQKKRDRKMRAVVEKPTETVKRDLRSKENFK